MSMASVGTQPPSSSAAVSGTALSMPDAARSQTSATWASAQGFAKDYAATADKMAFGSFEPWAESLQKTILPILEFCRDSSASIVIEAFYTASFKPPDIESDMDVENHMRKISKIAALQVILDRLLRENPDVKKQIGPAEEETADPPLSTL